VESNVESIRSCQGKTTSKENFSISKKVQKQVFIAF
jgi:hypothetical protein